MKLRMVDLIKSGDLVKLHGSLWSSYDREGETGLVLETTLRQDPGDVWVGDIEPNNFSRILWSKDNQAGICKTTHLEVISESR